MPLDSINAIENATNLNDIRHIKSTDFLTGDDTLEIKS